MSENGFENIAEMKLKHLPNKAILHLQRQKNKFVPEDKVQIGLPTSFLNENNKRVIMRGPSIQLEQIPELVKLLTETYEKYSGKKLSEANSAKTHTFADMIQD